MRSAKRVSAVAAALVLVLVGLLVPPPAWAPPLVFYSTTCASVTVLVTTTETVICTLTGVTTSAGQTIRLLGIAQITAGAGGTAATVRFRRGTSVSGVGVGNTATASVAAGNNVVIPVGAEDTPGELANGSYVLTAQQVAATANGSATTIELWAWAL